MTIRSIRAMACVIAAVIVVAGCESTGGSQMQTTVYDTHRRMVKLDRELEGSVGRLNETTATLLARVDESDQQTRMLRGLIEENQQKLDSLTREVRDMRATLYRHWGLTAPAPSAMPAPSAVPTRDVVPGQVTVESPPTMQTPPRHELLDSAPVPTDQFSAAPAAEPMPAPEMADEIAYAPTPAPVTPGGLDDPRVLYQQAQRSYSQDDFNTAFTQFETYLTRHANEDPNLSANAQFWKAKCLMNMDRYAESVQAFETLRATFPTSTKVPFAIHNQAVAHSRLGQTAQAERLMEAVIEQFPISPAADQARADLRKLRGE